MTDTETSDRELVIVGRIGAPHGVAGAVRVTSATQPPENIVHYRPWLVGDGAGAPFREVEVTSVRRQANGFVAVIAGIDDRDRAQALGGALIAVPRHVLPALDADREYYWQDLLGLTVRHVDGRTLGTVKTLLETGAHDVLVIERDGPELLVPFVGAFVLEVDLAARRIVVEWQEPV